MLRGPAVARVLAACVFTYYLSLSSSYTSHSQNR
jgi:hypothetical protein